MHIDDFSKIGRLIGKRTRLIEAKWGFLKMWETTVERAGNPAPLLIGSEYSLQDPHQINVRVWMNQYAADCISHTMDDKIGELDIELGKLGIFTHERKTEI